MSVETKYFCDTCGAVKGETNHWFVVGGLPGAIVVNRWESSDFASAQIHLCGQKCAHALLDRWLTTESLDANRHEQPTQIKFGAVIDPLLRLVKPIKLDVSSGEEAEVVVSWAEINEYGCGPTTGDALVDFGQSLRALYHELHAPDIQLGPDLVKVKATLDEFIVRRG